MSEQDFIEKRAQDILKLILNSSEHSKITLEHSLVIKSIIAEALKQEREIAILEIEAKRKKKAKKKKTWTDSTGLIWYPAIKGRFTWQEAIDKASELGLRFPTKEEFELAEKEGLRSKFNDFKGRWFWSSSPHPGVAGYAWVFDGLFGEVDYVNRDGDDSVRCVKRE